MGAEMSEDADGIFAASLARCARRNRGCGDRLRAGDPRHRTQFSRAEQRAAFEEKFSIARRLILAVDIAILATVGYWIGHALGGSKF
jgi:hypothetical protein